MAQPRYTYDQAYEASLLYFKGDALAARVWTSKYAVKSDYEAIRERTYLPGIPDARHRAALWDYVSEITPRLENLILPQRGGIIPFDASQLRGPTAVHVGGG